MSDSGNIHVGDVETVVEATPDEEKGGPAPADVNDDKITRTMERMQRDRLRTRAWGFDD